MGYIIPAAILAVLLALAVIGWLITPKTKTEREPYSRDSKEVPNPARTGAALVTAGLLVLLLAYTAVMSFSRVGAREVGVETAFGKYTRTLESGFHLAAPWSSVENFDTKLQSTDVQPTVGFSGGGGGTQPATVQWEIASGETVTEDAEALWRDFGTFQDVKDVLIVKTADDTIDRVMKSYTPAETLREDNAAELRERVRDDIAKRLAPYGITVKDVLMPTPNFNDKSREFLDRVQQSEANLSRSQIDKQTAENEAAADEIRNREASPESLTLECLDVTRTWNDDNNGPLPASWSCVGGGSVDLVKPVE